MRKLQIIMFIMFGNCMITTAQVVSKMDDNLQREMAQYARSEKLRINIILNEHYDQIEMLNKTVLFSGIADAALINTIDNLSNNLIK